VVIKYISLQVEGMTNLQVNILLMNTLPFTDIINYDWNIVGLDVSEKRNFFQEQYEAINESIHELAEGIMHLDLLIQ
jgi:DNA-binding ferritin-like protein